MRAAVNAIPGFEFVWQFVTLGAFVGGVLAYRRRRGDPHRDPFELITRWAVVGLMVGIAMFVIFEVPQ